MKKILPLSAGDQVALVCTGSICESKAETIGCQDYLLKNFNLKACFDQDNYMPLPAKVRADIFMRYVLDDNIKVIWSARGGEGSADIIPFLAARAHQIRQAKPKLLMGFSDFTALLIYFAQTFNWPTVHSAGVRQLYRGWVSKETEQATYSWLFSDEARLSLELRPLNQAAMTQREMHEQVLGGNLCLLQLSLKDLWEFQPQNKIVLLEEVNEQPYQISRMLKHFTRIGLFKQVRALVFAGCDFPAMDQVLVPEFERKMRKMLTNFAREVSVPVLFTDFIGHGIHNYPIPFNHDVKLQLLGGSARLSFAVS